MRNAWRLVVFDVLAPLATIAALAAIGVLLGWPLWWVSTCSVLVLLVVEGVAINFWLLRRDSVTVGTDDDAPGLRLAVVFLCAAAISAAVVTGYLRWTTPDRDFNRDSREVVHLATGMAETVASFSPSAPAAAVDRAAAMMVPEHAGGVQGAIRQVQRRSRTARCYGPGRYAGGRRGGDRAVGSQCCGDSAG